MTAPVRNCWPRRNTNEHELVNAPPASLVPQPTWRTFSTWRVRTLADTFVRPPAERPQEWGRGTQECVRHALRAEGTR